MLSEITQVIEQTPRILSALLSVAADDVLDWKPAPKRWSIHDVLAHLVDVEERGFRSRFAAMVANENAVIQEYDQDAIIESGMYKDVPARELLSRFGDEREATLRMLRGLPPGCEQRSGRHSALGTITIGMLLHEFAFHDLGHIRQVAEIYRTRVFFPHLGPFQSYYKVQP